MFLIPRESMRFKPSGPIIVPLIYNDRMFFQSLSLDCSIISQTLLQSVILNEQDEMIREEQQRSRLIAASERIPNGTHLVRDSLSL